MKDGARGRPGHPAPDRPVLSGLPLALVLTNPGLRGQSDRLRQRRLRPADRLHRSRRRSAATAASCRGRTTEPERGRAAQRGDRGRARTSAIEITNHRADGTPFLNRLTITPILDEGRRSPTSSAPRAPARSTIAEGRLDGGPAAARRGPAPGEEPPGDDRRHDPACRRAAPTPATTTSCWPGASRRCSCSTRSSARPASPRPSATRCRSAPTSAASPPRSATSTAARASGSTSSPRR